MWGIYCHDAELEIEIAAGGAEKVGDLLWSWIVVLFLLRRGSDSSFDHMLSSLIAWSSVFTRSWRSLYRNRWMAGPSIKFEPLAFWIVL